MKSNKLAALAIVRTLDELIPEFAEAGAIADILDTDQRIQMYTATKYFCDELYAVNGLMAYYAKLDEICSALTVIARNISRLFDILIEETDGKTNPALDMIKSMIKADLVRLD